MKILRLAPFLLSLPTPLLAAPIDRDTALKLPDVVISANRQVEDRNQSSAATTVFTRDDIERLQPGNVTDLLTRVPGVQVARTGGRGSLPGIFVRGTKAAQTLVLVDGQRIANTSSGDSALQYLDVEQIERVEVLRGSRSAIYGSDAMGGVIQIFTRRGAEQGLQGRLRLAAGSQQTFQRSLGLSGGDGRTRFSLGASLDESAGIDDTRQSFPSDKDHDTYRNRSLSLSLSHQLSDDVEMGINVLDNHGKREFDSPFGSELKPWDEFSLSSISGYLGAQLSDQWHSRLELGHSENRGETRDKLDLSSTFTTYRDSLAWQNTFDLNDAHSLLLGGDAWVDRLNADGLYANARFEEDSRWNRAVLIQHRFQGEHFSTELGLRRDRNQQFGGQNTWSGSLTVPLNVDNDLLLSYSEGFRAPTFNDLYYPAFGNPDLKPEHSKSYELQWRSQLGDSSRLETSLYRTDLRDAIAFAVDAPYNVDKARIIGFETTLKQDWFGWQSQLGVALLDPRDQGSGHTLERRARRTLSLDLDRQFDRLGVGASWQAVSSSYADVDNQRQLGGYGLVGARASWALTPEIRLDLKADNLLNKDYSRSQYSYAGSFHGYREEGRTWMLAINWTPEL
ncbi:TonB-dependent receptor [Pseudomonas sp. 148P]|uniref:TonB-dependent receptor n=1 Tax=Pseudomonas ulcerans TaxID=3115852 RepID=A0ABU7HLB6_9PSED|nr:MULTISPECIES: TonB-dependent receptor [unclassified Pseudomonas]MEE1920789.1 TonB-dependent receptor [Pseudomonas sp. 147P]MEE1932310.1 TonB-dependent receptor [Pseudomonas sp. 148P]